VNGQVCDTSKDVKEKEEKEEGRAPAQTLPLYDVYHQIHLNP
jgi:hypothetical protein